ncbi:MAG TPA: methylmalonyl-CoA mutase family protein [Thermodesulfobacteriota bacterium]|nr:methylmalonyl-CoA mutase family protein [Thermodesulfobacteriota bacterium]
MFDPKKSEEIGKQAKEWNGKIEKTLAKNPERRKTFQTTSGIPVKRIFTPEDVAGLDYEQDLNFPGEFPYTRGVQPTMYRGRFWTMRQYAGFGTAEDTNRRYRYLLEQGQTGLSVAFDLPTQIGYDSDHPLAQGEVGKVGVAIDSVKDMEILFDQIPLDKVSTSMTINAPASILLAMYIAVGEKQGVAAAKLNGTIQNDILKEYSSRGTYIFPPRPSMRIITNTFEYCTKEVPNWNTISISGYHMREAGCTAVQEVAFTLANGVSYVQAAIKAGLDVDEFGPRISFFFNAHLDFLEEVAKYRAARRLWAKIMRDRFKAQNPRSWMIRFHTQTAGSTLTAQQPYNNIIRVAWQALAAVLGGTQSLHTNSMDEALALPSEQSVQVALRTQQLIAHESGSADTIDPLGGSYYIEKLTDEIEKRAMDYIDKIDQLGGSVVAVEKGYIQQEIQDAAYRYQKEIESGDRVIVGVNRFQSKEPPPKGLLKVDPKVREVQIKRIAELKTSRSSQGVKTSLEALKKVARGEGNLMVPILSCVRTHCTLGEVCDALRSVFGEYESAVKV